MYQKIIVVGNLGGDPQMRYMSDGTPVTNFSMATNRRWTDRNTGQPVDETTWFRVSVWGRQAEAVNQYLSKGRRVLVEGRLRPDENGGPRLFTRQDGTVGASFEITADSVQFLGGRDETDNGGYQSEESFDQSPVEEEDDIPF
ncbi:MAG TPA: single-stranded DNA-binding protein [Candidatus Binatia bacterium]|jgi:single-strand DNA-binding protein|nr:single-stranded DNA-binding protein [Candidatus Binatia bacterium]